MSDNQPHPPIPQVVDWARHNRPAPEQKTDSTWFRNEAITGGNWNQLFPYQLLVVDQLASGAYKQRSTLLDGDFKFTLPIPPEAFSISMPFAIQASVTLGGYMEEHNGAPTRMISLSGSTGVNLGRSRAPRPNFSFVDSIAAGTIQAALATGRLAQSIGEPAFATNVHDQSDFDDVSDTGHGSLTGYYQFRLLQLFFESYAELKKTKAGRRSRLALATWKDEAVYLVSPVSFDVRRDVVSPLEYKYSIQLKAFKRIKLDKGSADISSDYIPIKNSPSKLAKALNAIQQVRGVVAGAKKTIEAIDGDINRSLLEPMRQTMLLCKDILGIPLTAADLADSVIQDAKSFIILATSTGNAADHFKENVARRFKFVGNNARSINDNVNELAGEQQDVVDTSMKQSNLVATHPANSAFTNPSDNWDFFSKVNIGTLNLPPAIQAKIAAGRNQVQALTRTDFQAMAEGVRATADQYAAAVNAGNATYNRIYGLEAPATTIVNTPTDEDFNTLFHLNQLAMEFERFAVTTNTNPKLTAIAVVAGLATKSGIAFRMPRSKFAVPFPYGSTLEQIAFKYLGNPDRWQEIAALNGLQEPYVDEVGFTLPLLVNGSGNTVFVADDDNLYVGQPVWIRSDTIVRTPRTITKIDELSPTQFMVTVDGDADLDVYVTLGNAVLEAFLPNTVNGQMLIYIPSDLEPKDEDFTSRTIPGIDEHDSLIAVGGIDLLLTPGNDLIITPDGDSRWSVGLTNIIQKVRLALSVTQGTLNRHPNYGLPLEVGQSLADLSAAQVVRAAQGMFAGDPTFTGIKAASITVAGPLANLNIAVQVAGVSQVIPISAEVSRR